jgi:hypothetical protein
MMRKDVVFVTFQCSGSELSQTRAVRDTVIDASYTGRIYPPITEKTKLPSPPLCFLSGLKYGIIHFG